MRTTLLSPKRLRAQGFREDTNRGAPLCRCLIDEMKLDGNANRREDTWLYESPVASRDRYGTRDRTASWPPHSCRHRALLSGDKAGGLPRPETGRLREEPRFRIS